MRRFLKYSLLTILFLFIIIIAAVAWLISTESGLQFIGNQAKNFAPGELKIAKLEGRIIDRVSFNDLSYQDGETKAKIESFVFDWDARALLSAKVHLEQLHINNIEINLPKSEAIAEEPESESGSLEIPDIKLPVQIALDDIQINHISIQTADAEPFIINNINLQSQTSDHLTLQNFQVTAPLFNLKLAGDVGFIKPHRMQLDLSWNANLPDFKVVGQGEISGDMEKMILTHQVSEPLAIDLQTTVTDLVGDLNLEVKLTWQEIYWPLDVPEKMVISQQGTITVTGGLDNYNFAVQTKVDGQQIPASNWRISGQGNQQQVTISTLHSELLEGLLDINGQFSWTPKMLGHVNLDLQSISIKEFWPDWPDELTIDTKIMAKLDGDNFQIDNLVINIPQTKAEISLQAAGLIAGDNPEIKIATLNWRGLQWPLIGEELVNSKQGQIDISGTMQNYQVALATQVAGGQVPASQITLRGKGNLQQFTVESLKTKLLEGEINTAGSISWQPKLVGKLDVAVKKLNLKELWKDWPDKLRLDTKLAANLDGETFKLAISRGNPLWLPLPNLKNGKKSKGNHEGLPLLSLIATGKLGKIPNFDATLAWQKLQWPLVGKNSMVTSKTGQVHIFGTTEDYKVKLTTQVDGQQVPSTHIGLLGQGNLQQFNLKSLHSELLQGKIDINGKVNWQSKLAAKLNLNVNKLNLKEVWKDWPNKLRLDTKLVADLDGDKFKIRSLKINLPKTAAQISLQADGLLGEIPSFDATVNWRSLQWPLVGKDSIVTSKTGKITLVGNTDDYKLNITTQVDGQQVPTSKIKLSGQGDLEHFTINSLNTKTLQGAINANGEVNWQSALVAQLNLNVDKIALQEVWPDWPKELKLNSNLVAGLEGDNFQINKFDISIPQTNMELSLTSSGTTDGKIITAILNWQDLQWPLENGEIVNSKTGVFSIDGGIQSYQLQLDTELKGKDIPAGRWQAMGHGNDKSLQLSSLQGDILQGILDLSGQVQWQPNLNWKFTLQGENINPGEQWKEWPGELAMNIQTEGNMDKKLTTKLKINQLGGKLRDYPLNLETDIDIDGNIYKINKLDFSSGEAYLTANGRLGDKSNLVWEINAPDLQAFLPDAKGNIVGKGSMTGPLNLPHVKVQLKANSIVFQQNNLQKLTADIDVNLRGSQKLFLDVIATNLIAGATQINNIKLQSDGSLSKHTITASVAMPTDNFLLQLKGGLQQMSSWQGKLQQINLNTKKSDNWKLANPTPLFISAERVNLGQACLQNTKTAGKLCTQANWSGKSGSELQIDIKKLSLELLQAFLPENMNIKDGAINGGLQTTLRPDGKINSNVAINIAPGIFSITTDDKVEKLKFAGGDLNLKINNKGLDGGLKLKMLNRSNINGQIKMPKLTHVPPQGKQPLKASLTAKFGDLDILPTFVPQAENTKGQVGIDVTVAGSLEKPKIEGKIQIIDVATELPDLGLILKDFNLALRSDGSEKIYLNAGIRSGECDSATCQLNFKGQANLPSFTKWDAEININGKDFEVVNMPNAWVLISPDINIKLAPENIAVIGDLLIPEAAFTPPKGSSGGGAVAISNDVIFVDEQVEEPVEKTSGGMQIATNIKVIFGDNITFEGAGVKSRIGGTLIASNEPGKATVGNGELWIDGTFKAYGQNLTINKGKIFFAGGPIENPGLDIRAFRRINGRGSSSEEVVLAGGTRIRGDEDVISGLHINGTAQNLRMDLYSEPAMDESNMLSYIVLGKPASQAGSSGGDLLLAAAAELPLSKSNALTKKIGDDFGLDEAGISSEDGVEHAAFVLGKYLTPELYVSYGIGLFDGSNLLKMRYQLTKRLTLETETGTQSGVDLRYTFER